MSHTFFKKILIAVDESEYSLNAAKVGLALAKQLNAEIAFLFVVDTSKAIGTIEAGVFPQDILIMLKKEAQRTIDQIVKMFNPGEFIQFTPEGHPKEDIVKTARIWEADLIIIGTHSKTGLVHILGDNITDHIVHHTSIPVLVVPFL